VSAEGGPERVVPRRGGTIETFPSAVLQDVLNYAGVTAFACSGALAGDRKESDLWGIRSMGAATGDVGGAVGTRRVPRPRATAPEKKTGGSQGIT
jgi:hypothetical protein